MKEISEISNVSFDPNSNLTTYRESRYELASDGSKHVLDFTLTDVPVFGEDGETPIEGELSIEDVLNYARERADKDVEIVSSDSQTTEDTKAKTEKVDPIVTVTKDEPVEKVLVYVGKKVISEGNRIVNEKSYHHLRLEDGSTYDLTDGDYQEFLNTN